MPTTRTAISRATIAERRLAVSRMRAFGYTEEQIAKRLGVSRSTVTGDLYAARQEAARYYRETARHELATAVAEDLEAIQAAALQEYERSRRPARTRRIERDGLGNVVKDITTVEGRIGDSRLLGAAHKSIEQRRQLLGLDAPPASITDDDGQGADAVVVEVTARGEAQTIMRAGDAAIRVTVTAAEDRQPSAVTVDGAVSGQPSAVSPTPQGLPCPISAGQQPPDAPTTPQAPTGGDSAPEAPPQAGGAPASIDDRKQKRKRTPRKPK